MKLLILMAILTSCSHSTHLVNMSDHSVRIDQSKSKKISSETQQQVFMGFVFDTDYVDRAKSELIDKCPNGAVRNITTRYSTSHGFFHWYNKIFMQGQCFKR